MGKKDMEVKTVEEMTIDELRALSSDELYTANQELSNKRDAIQLKQMEIVQVIDEKRADVTAAGKVASMPPAEKAKVLQILQAESIASAEAHGNTNAG
jgi:hypothetical protein